MQRPFWKSVIIATALAFGTLLLTGCGAIRLGYRQGPELSYWWLDGYVDFNENQTHQARTALADWFRWHRETQLPDYAKFLTGLQTLAAGPVTAAQVCQVFDQGRGRLTPLIDRALPLAVPIVQTLGPKQFTHLEKKYEKVNREFRDDYLQPDPKDRLKASVKRFVDRTETLYGRLSDAQRTQITQAVVASPFNPELWLEERQLRQQEALKALRQVAGNNAPAEQVQTALHTLVEHVQHSPREVYVAYQAKLDHYNCGVIAELHNSASAEQRQSAVKKLKGWEEDARVLASEAPR